MSAAHRSAPRLVTSAEEIALAYPLMCQLGRDFDTVEAFTAAVQLQQTEGYRLALLEHDGRTVTVAGFRIQHILATGKTLYVDDLVTNEDARSQGHGLYMLDWLKAYAREQGCATLSLDSGTKRQEAHAFYFREGMRVTSFHFYMPVR